MDNELIILKAELYDANKTIANLNKVLSEIAKRLEVKEGSSLDDLFSTLDKLLADSKAPAQAPESS